MPLWWWLLGWWLTLMGVAPFSWPDHDVWSEQVFVDVFFHSIGASMIVFASGLSFMKREDR